MYTLKMSYGDYGDEPGMATMASICEIDTRFGEIERGRSRYYVSYGRVELNEYYYEVSIIER